MNADVRGDPVQPPHPTPRHTSNTRICLLRGGRAKLLHRTIDRVYPDFGAADALPFVAMVQIGIRMS